MKNGEELQIQLGLGHLTYVSFIPIDWGSLQNPGHIL